MELTMDWIKKNWITIAVVVLIVAVIIYFMNKKKAKPVRAGAKTGGSSALKNQLAVCEQNATAIRMIPGTEHPCTKLRNAVAAESGYFVQEAGSSNYEGEGGNISDQLNIVDYAIGNQGMGMLEENNFNMPDFKLRQESNYGGVFSTTNGLNVEDFAIGNDGMALLMDRNLKAKA
jgi:hypothetical protein